MLVCLRLVPVHVNWHKMCNIKLVMEDVPFRKTFRMLQKGFHAPVKWFFTCSHVEVYDKGVYVSVCAGTV